MKSCLLKRPEIFQNYYYFNDCTYFRLLWTRLRVVQLYMDNVSPPGIQSNQSERDSIRLLGVVSRVLLMILYDLNKKQKENSKDSRKMFG